MITPEYLLNLAIELNANGQHMKAAEAEFCAYYMEFNQIKEVKSIGDIGDIPYVTKGSIVAIKRGTKVWSTNPSCRERIVVRPYRVRVHNVFSGFVPYINYHNTPFDNINVKPKDYEISWAGQHGYWCHCSINDIVPVEDDIKPAGAPIVWEGMGEAVML